MTTPTIEPARRARWPWIILAIIVGLIVISLVILAFIRPDRPTDTPSTSTSGTTNTSPSGDDRDQVSITGPIGTTVSAVDGVTPKGFPAHCLGAVQAATIAESILDPSLPIEPAVYDALIEELSGGIGGASVVNQIGNRQKVLDWSGTVLDVIPHLSEGFWRLQSCEAGSTATIDLVMVSTNIDTGRVGFRTSRIGLLWYERDWHIQTRDDAEKTPMDDFSDERPMQFVKIGDAYQWTVNDVVVEVPVQDSVRAYFLGFEGWNGYVR